MQIDFKLDGCKMSLFWSDWIKGGEAAVIDLTQFQDFDIIHYKKTKINRPRYGVNTGVC